MQPKQELANHGPFTAKPISRHVHSTLRVTIAATQTGQLAYAHIMVYGSSSYVGMVPNKQSENPYKEFTELLPVKRWLHKLNVL